MEIELYSLSHPVYSIENIEYEDDFRFEDTLDHYFDNKQYNFRSSSLKLKTVFTNSNVAKSIMEENLGLLGLVFKEELLEIMKNVNALDSVIVKTMIESKKEREPGFVFLYKGISEENIDYESFFLEVLDISSKNIVDKIKISGFDEYFDLSNSLSKENKFLKINSIVFKNTKGLMNLDLFKLRVGGRHLFSKKLVEEISEKVSDVKFEKTRIKYLCRDFQQTINCY